MRKSRDLFKKIRNTMTTFPVTAAKSLQSCPTLRPHRRQPTRLPHPWDSPGKNTGVGCHFLLQCMKVKSESEVAQSCPTLRDPMDCRPPESSTHGIFKARVLEWGAIAFSFPWKMGTIKKRNGMDLTEAEGIKKRWQEHIEELYKNYLNYWDNHNGVITHPESHMRECEVK